MRKNQFFGFYLVSEPSKLGMVAEFSTFFMYSANLDFSQKFLYSSRNCVKVWLMGLLHKVLTCTNIQLKMQHKVLNRHFLVYEF